MGTQTVQFRDASLRNYNKKKQAEKSRPKLELLEEKLDELTDWLIDHGYDDPEWDGKVSEFHQVEQKIKVLTSVKPNFSGGIEEVSIQRTNLTQ